MQLAMLRELGLPQMPEPHDVADALAIALCHYHLRDTPERESAVDGYPSRGVNLTGLVEDGMNGDRSR